MSCISQIFSAAVDRGSSGASSWPPVQCPHCALVVDSVVITAVTGLDVEVQPSVQLIELFRLRLGLDLLSRHTAILKGVVQFYTLSS